MLDRDDLELYDVPVAVEVVARLRGQVRFDTVEDLVAQMGRDVERTRELVAKHAAQAEPEAWFLAHGLPYFVAAERAAARAGLRPRRLVPLLVVLLLVAAAAGGLLGWVSDQYSAVPAIWLSLTVLGLLGYGATALHAGPIVGFAMSRTLGSVRVLLPMVSRALPLLLVFVTFLFINAEAWEMTTNLPFGLLWVTVLLMLGLAVLFQLVRLPEEVDRVDDAVDQAFVIRACAGTPLEQAAHDLVADPGRDPAAHAQVTGFERWNLILVLLVIQTVQVLLLSVAVFAFFLLFGSLVMQTDTQLSWTGLEPDELRNAPVVSNLSVELVQVSVFLAAFSGLYFAVAVMTDETYKEQFFKKEVLQELERAVGVRAGYLALQDATTGAGSDEAPDAGR